MKSGSWASYQAALPPEARAGGEPESLEEEYAMAKPRSNEPPTAAEMERETTIHDGIPAKETLKDRTRKLEPHHWSHFLVDFMMALGRDTGCILVGEDEGEPEGDTFPAQVTIGHLPGRWWIIIKEKDEEPVIAMTDGTIEGTNTIWFHDDGQPFRDELIRILTEWKRAALQDTEES